MQRGKFPRPTVPNQNGDRLREDANSSARNTEHNTYHFHVPFGQRFQTGNINSCIKTPFNLPAVVTCSGLT